MTLAENHSNRDRLENATNCHPRGAANRDELPPRSNLPYCAAYGFGVKCQALVNLETLGDDDGRLYHYVIGGPKDRNAQR